MTYTIHDLRYTSVAGVVRSGRCGVGRGQKAPSVRPPSFRLRQTSARQARETSSTKQQTSKPAQFPNFHMVSHGFKKKYENRRQGPGVRVGIRDSGYAICDTGV